MNTSPVVPLLSTQDSGPKSKEIFEKTEAKGKIPSKWMRVMAHADTIYPAFFSLFKAVMGRGGSVDQILKWKIAYRVSQLNQCKFCVDATMSKLNELGIPKEAPDSSTDEKEQIAIRYAEEVNNNAYKVNPDLINKMKKYYSDEQIVEITSVAGLYGYLNKFNDALNILPDV